MAARLTILLTLVATTAMAAATLEAPTSADVGSAVDVEVAGSTNERDFVTIVPKGLLVAGQGGRSGTAGPCDGPAVAAGVARESRPCINACASTLARMIVTPT